MNARQPVGTPKPCFRQERRPPSDAEIIFRGTQEHPPTPFKHPNHAFDKNDDRQAMPKSYSGDNPEFSKLVRTFVSPGRGVEVLSALNPPNAAERHTSWLLARKEERGPSLPLNPPHPARQRPFFETSSLPRNTRLFPGRVSKRHVDTTLGSEHGSNSFRFHASRPLPRPRHQLRAPRPRSLRARLQFLQASRLSTTATTSAPGSHPSAETRLSLHLYKLSTVPHRRNSPKHRPRHQARIPRLKLASASD